MNKNNCINILAIFGTFLLLICVFGQFKSLRNPSILFDNKCLFKNDIIIDYGRAISKCIKLEQESNEDYVKRISKLVFNSMAHYWNDDTEDNYYQRRIPLWENYIMYIAHLLFPPNDGMGYELVDYKKALERGFGLCSQHSLAAIDILKSSNIEARLVCLQGHIVVTVLSDDLSWYIIDPDFGIVIPFDLETIQNNIDLVIPYYINGEFTPASNTKEYYAKRISKYYDRSGNIILPDISCYCGRKDIWLQKGSYALKWFFPLLCIIPFLFKYYFRTRNYQATLNGISFSKYRAGISPDGLKSLVKNKNTDISTSHQC